MTISTYQPSKYFIGLLILIFLLVLQNLNVDYEIFTESTRKEVPIWIFIVLLILDLVTVLSLIGSYLGRKTAVIAFPIAVLIHFIIHVIFFGQFMYMEILQLFLFIGFGLFFIIPDWDKLK